MPETTDRDDLAKRLHAFRGCTCAGAIGPDYDQVDKLLAAGWVSPAEVKRREDAARTEALGLALRHRFDRGRNGGICTGCEWEASLADYLPTFDEHVRAAAARATGQDETPKCWMESSFGHDFCGIHKWDWPCPYATRDKP